MTSVHPVVPYDPGLIEDISARMDLRAPNAEAVAAVARAFDAAGGTPFEAVCDLATAVGKTYLSGALIDYLAASGIRNFVLVTPGRTILDKTVNNFTPGHPKSVVGGMDAAPQVITIDNFNSASVAAALADDNTVKLFVFTIQSLLRPDKTTRKAHKYQEWLGEDLYGYLRDQDDLVVLADESHVYSDRAAAFSAAMRDLDAMAVIGLTATPAPTDRDKVIYHYPLARAIAEQYVKTPVLVGRKDDRSDTDTRLRDGLLLLEAKQKTVNEYAAATGTRAVNAVMFVVTDTIDAANSVADVLRKPGLFGDDYDNAVLVIHSDAPEDALARLATVEDPDSPVRVIVSVSMLKEGWDVANIFVICSFRPSISDALTEQTLGRGLRLPWGAYTDVELLDTVEILSHEKYEKLLANAGVLLEGLVPDRTAAGGGVPADKAVPAGGAPTPKGEVQTQPEQVVSVTTATSDEEVQVTATVTTGGGTPGVTTPTVVIASIDERAKDANQAAATTGPVPPRPDVEVKLPKVTKTVTARNFSLSAVADDPFTELGHRLASGGGTTLDRKRLDVIADPDAPTGYRLVPVDAATSIEASTAELPFGGVRDALRHAILAFDFVPTDKASINAARRLADAVVAGAGGETALASYTNAAIYACHQILKKAWRSSPPVVTTDIEVVNFDLVRVNSRPVEHNRFGPFSRKVAYDGWSSSLYPLNWFDSTPERTFANLVDADKDVEVWSRILRGEMTVESDRGRYTPDFYLRNGVHYLVEVKADKDVDTDVVQAKKAAAEDWARYVTDHGVLGTWRYLLVPEGVLRTAKTFSAVVTQSGG